MNIQNKYRPQNINDFLFNDGSLKKIVDQYVNKKQTRPLILYGSYGTGKSLLAELLPKAIENASNPIVNKVLSSDLNSTEKIDEIFNRNKQFDKLFGNNHYNYYIVEELNFDPKARNRLRTVLEDNEGVDLVIFTTNEIHKVDSGIKSRAMCVEVKALTPEKFVDSAESILKAEGKIPDKDELLKGLTQVYDNYKDNREYYKFLEILLS